VRGSLKRRKREHGHHVTDNTKYLEDWTSRYIQDPDEIPQRKSTGSILKRVPHERGRLETSYDYLNEGLKDEQHHVARREEAPQLDDSRATVYNYIGDSSQQDDKEEEEEEEENQIQ